MLSQLLKLSSSVVQEEKAPNSTEDHLFFPNIFRHAKFVFTFLMSVAQTNSLTFDPPFPKPFYLMQFSTLIMLFTLTTIWAHSTDSICVSFKICSSSSSKHSKMESIWDTLKQKEKLKIKNQSICQSTPPSTTCYTTQ